MLSYLQHYPISPLYFTLISFFIHSPHRTCSFCCYWPQGKHANLATRPLKCAGHCSTIECLNVHLTTHVDLPFCRSYELQSPGPKYMCSNRSTNLYWNHGWHCRDSQGLKHHTNVFLSYMNYTTRAVTGKLELYLDCFQVNFGHSVELWL